MTLALLIVGATLLSLTSITIGVALHRWVFADLGAQRRGRRTAMAGLAEIAGQYPDAAQLALAAFDAAALPGDPTVAELIKGPG